MLFWFPEELYEALDDGIIEADYEIVKPEYTELQRGGDGRGDSGLNSFRTEEGIDISVIMGSITAQKVM